MPKTKKILKILGIGLLSFLVLLGGLLTLSPLPSTMLLAKAFNGPVKITNPKNYEKSAAQVIHEHNLSYGSSKAEKFDLLTNKNKSENAVIIWVHGGGFIGGDKAGSNEFLTNLVADTGIKAVNMNYTLAPKKKYPAQLKELNQVVQKIKANKMLVHAKTKIVIGGDSAGAQIAAQYLALQTNKHYAQKVGIKQLKMNFAGSVLYCGPYDFKLIYEEGKQSSSPIMKWFIHTVGWAMSGKFFWQKSAFVKEANFTKDITKAYPSTYLTDGNTFTFESSGKALTKKLRQEGVKTTSRFFPSTQKVPHEYQFDYATKDAQITYQQTRTFIEKIIK